MNRNRRGLFVSFLVKRHIVFILLLVVVIERTGHEISRSSSNIVVVLFEFIVRRWTNRSVEDQENLLKDCE